MLGMRRIRCDLRILSCGAQTERSVDLVIVAVNHVVRGSRMLRLLGEYFLSNRRRLHIGSEITLVDRAKNRKRVKRGRFQILEFPPRVRVHDQIFHAPQAMLDAGYTGLFHFHLHVQRPRNLDFTGPGPGDRNYANATRANCLVFTSVREDTLNVDFYRHGGVVVDLGVVRR